MNLKDYVNLDGIALAESIRRGEVTCEEVLNLVYRIIAEFDGDINAFVSLEETDARQAAATRTIGALDGVPIAMKDCVGFVKDAPRSFGSRLAVGTVIDFDDEVVARYKRAGLIPIGTTNVPEFSSSVTTESLLHGPCRNPWDLSRSVGGSSGGAAAAVAYGAVPIAYGNDAAGSIRVPSSCCGVFGLRPSRGRVPTGPVYGEFWHGLMVHHVITRSVRDSALVLDVSEGIDDGPLYGVPDKQRPFLDECTRAPGKLNIAVSDGSELGHEIHADCLAALKETVALLEELGHNVEWLSPDYQSEKLRELITTLLSLSLAQEISETAAQTGRIVGPDTVEACHLELMRRGKNVSGLQLAAVLDYKSELSRMMGRFFQKHDVYLTPTLAEPPIALGELDSNSKDMDKFMRRFWSYCPFTPLANVCGLPSMSVPLCWTAGGLPVGMMFSAAYANEALLFRLAGQLEQARPWKDRHAPHSAWSE
jgi:amidase